MSQRSLRDELVAEESADEILLKAFEDLEEKRSSTRELALCSIIRSLSHRFQGELIDAKLDSWFEAIKRVAQRQGREALLSNRVLALCWISVGSNPKYYDDVLALLQNGIRNGTAEHKASCIATLAIIAFIEDAGDAATWELLNAFEEILEDTDDAEVIASTLDAYGLLYSTASTKLDQDEFNRILDTHMALLESDDVDVRIAAGENIAIILEDSAKNIDEICAQQDDSPNAKRYYSSHNELLSHLVSLSSDSSRHRAKKDRTVQKSAFRDILQTVENNHPPSVKLKIKHEVVDCDSWSKIRRLNAFRSAIGEGLTAHFIENRIVQHAFEFSLDGVAPGKTTSSERRLFQSIVGKARTKALKEQRGSKHATKSDADF
eukprot:jgi/Hompol1/433/HPOL_000150-RA